jgi:hypothetical protein
MKKSKHLIVFILKFLDLKSSTKYMISNSVVKFIKLIVKNILDIVSEPSLLYELYDKQLKITSI